MAASSDNATTWRELATAAVSYPPIVGYVLPAFRRDFNFYEVGVERCKTEYIVVPVPAAEQEVTQAAGQEATEQAEHQAKQALEPKATDEAALETPQAAEQKGTQTTGHKERTQRAAALKAKPAAEPRATQTAEQKAKREADEPLPGSNRDAET